MNKRAIWRYLESFSLISWPEFHVDPDNCAVQSRQYLEEWFSILRGPMGSLAALRNQ